MDVILHPHKIKISIPTGGFRIKLQVSEDDNGEISVTSHLQEDRSSSSIIVRVQDKTGVVSTHAYQGLGDALHIDLHHGSGGLANLPPGPAQHPPCHGAGGLPLLVTGPAQHPPDHAAPQPLIHPVGLPPQVPGPAPQPLNHVPVGLPHHVPGPAPQPLNLGAGVRHPRRVVQKRFTHPCGTVMPIRQTVSRVEFLLHGRTYSRHRNADNMRFTYWACPKKAAGCLARAKTDNQTNILLFFTDHSC